jgi:geranylgeranyl diphosphate synthase type I
MGQHLDMTFSSRNDVTDGEYLEMVEKKTGALYGASAASLTIAFSSRSAMDS